MTPNVGTVIATKYVPSTFDFRLCIQHLEKFLGPNSAEVITESTSDYCSECQFFYRGEGMAPVMCIKSSRPYNLNREEDHPRTVMVRPDSLLDRIKLLPAPHTLSPSFVSP